MDQPDSPSFPDISHIWGIVCHHVDGYAHFTYQTIRRYVILVHLPTLHTLKPMDKHLIYFLPVWAVYTR